MAGSVRFDIPTTSIRRRGNAISFSAVFSAQWQVYHTPSRSTLESSVLTNLASLPGNTANESKVSLWEGRKEGKKGTSVKPETWYDTTVMKMAGKHHNKKRY